MNGMTQGPTGPEPPVRRSRRGTFIALAIAAALLIPCAGVVCWQLAVNLRPDGIEIPDVVGMTAGDAQDAISIRSQVVFVRSTDAHPGVVVAQSHEPGTKTHHDDIVTLDVAGPVPVPNVVGYYSRVAQNMLAEVGLSWSGSTYDAGSNEPSETVIAQTPAAGELTMSVDVALTIAGPAPEW